MRIHENPVIEQTAIETIASLQLGMEAGVLEYLITVYEEAEEYEMCLGIKLGIEYYNTKNFGCRVSNITEVLEETLN